MKLLYTQSPHWFGRGHFQFFPWFLIARPFLFQIDVGICRPSGLDHCSRSSWINLSCWYCWSHCWYYYILFFVWIQPLPSLIHSALNVYSHDNFWVFPPFIPLSFVKCLTHTSFFPRCVLIVPKWTLSDPSIIWDARYSFLGYYSVFSFSWGVGFPCPILPSLWFSH